LALNAKEFDMMILGVEWSDAVEAIVSVLGFAFVIYQIGNLRKSVVASAHDRLEAHYFNVLNCLLQKPHLRPFFYNNKFLSTDTSKSLELRAEVDIVSEMILALIEHAALQRKSLIDGTWEHCWLPYAKERLAKSSELRQFLAENRNWYTPEIQKLIQAT
jgi:hypothetical protein